MTTPRPIGDGLGDTLARLRAKYHPADAGLELEPGPVDLTAVAPPEERLSELRRARWAAMVPARFAWATLDDVEPAPRAELEAWVAHPQGRNVVLLGPVGTGKTHAALAAAQARALAGDAVRFLPIVELLDELRPSGPELAFATLAEVDLLVIDDLGAERATDWTDERLGALINRRWLEELPTIATTNLEPKDLEATLGARTYSRLAGNGSLGIRLTGVDRRRA